MGINKRLLIPQDSGVVNTENFAPITYTGNRLSRSISTGFAPDFVWIKNRPQGDPHMLFDSVRGATKFLFSNDADAEGTSATSLTSFNSDGFSLGAYDGRTNELVNYVAWCWKAGGAAVSNTDGTLTAQVSANVDSGFSIATYTGVGYPNSTTATVGHGLNSAPELIIIKKRDSTSPGNGSWVVGTEYAGSGWDGSLYLNSTNAYYNAINYFWNGDPTDSLVKLKNDWFVNGNNSDYVMYSFHSVDGYQKIGTYTGTGVSGISVTTGFQPRFIMVKATSRASAWLMMDTVRDTVSPMTEFLVAETGGAEFSAPALGFGFNSTGFSVDNTDGTFNDSGETYIYLAIA